MNIFKLPNKVYDFVKNLVTVGLPALTALLTGLGAIWGWDVGNIVQTTGVIALFLGALLGISNVPFQRAGGGVAGDIQVVAIPDDRGGLAKTTVVSFNEDPGTLIDGQQISLRFREKPVDISNL